jgi:hypothetical protein
MSSRVLGMIAMVPVTRAHASEDEAIARVESSFGEVSEAGQRLDRHSALFGAVAWVHFMLLQLGILASATLPLPETPWLALSILALLIRLASLLLPRRNSRFTHHASFPPIPYYERRSLSPFPNLFLGSLRYTSVLTII